MGEIDRGRVVARLAAQFDAVVGLCDGLTDTDWALPTCLPGWDVKDNVAHMAGTERMLLGEATPEVDPGDPPHVRNDIGRVNEAWVVSMRPLRGHEVLAAFRSATTARMAALSAMSQADFDEPSWTPAGQATYGRFMRIRFFDCHLHEQDVREALGLPLRSDADDLHLALDEVATGLGYLAGKRAELPAGTGLRIELSDPERRFDVDVAERARVVERLDRTPDVVVRLPSTTFLRLVGGRREAPVVGAGGIEVEGDGHLGGRFVGALAFTV